MSKPDPAVEESPSPTAVYQDLISSAPGWLQEAVGLLYVVPSLIFRRLPKTYSIAMGCVLVIILNTFLIGILSFTRLGAILGLGLSIGIIIVQKLNNLEALYKTKQEIEAGIGGWID
jgi:hypothetical protein